MPYDESDDYDVYEIIDQAYNEADRMSRPIHLLLETYQKYEEHDPNADRVADDREALEWLDDYWEYVKWNEHGNESSIDEVGGFRGFARTVTDSDYVDSTLDYLIYEDDPELIDPTARDLADRLKIIANRYGALRKMKKYLSNNEDQILGFIQSCGSVSYEEIQQHANEQGISDIAFYRIMDTLEIEGYIEEDENGDYVAKSTKKSKMKKSIYDANDWDNDEFYGDNNQRQRLLDYVKRTGTYKGSVPDGRGERQFYDMPDGYTVQFVIDTVLDTVTDVWRTKDFSEWNFPEIQKSQDIHSMIADIRKNNNSLVKSRVDLNGQLKQSR